MHMAYIWRRVVRKFDLQQGQTCCILMRTRQCTEHVCHKPNKLQSTNHCRSHLCLTAWILSLLPLLLLLEAPVTRNKQWEPSSELLSRFTTSFFKCLFHTQFEVATFENKNINTRQPEHLWVFCMFLYVQWLNVLIVNTSNDVIMKT